MKTNLIKTLLFSGALVMPTTSGAEWKLIQAEDNTHTFKVTPERRTSRRLNSHFKRRPYAGEMLSKFQRPPFERSELKEILPKGSIHCSDLVNAFMVVSFGMFIEPICFQTKEDIQAKFTDVKNGQSIIIGNYEMRAVRIDYNVTHNHGGTSGWTSFMVLAKAQGEAF